MKDRAEINGMVTRKTIEKINETKYCFFLKNNKFDKPSPRLREKKEDSNK